jgi:hypothetical protein
MIQTGSLIVKMSKRLAGLRSQRGFARPSWSRGAATVLAVGAVVVAGTGTAVAANGGTLTLGHHNRETHTTTLSNSSGPALRLQSQRGKPPLLVGNRVKVPKLNAALLDGHSAQAFQRAPSHLIVLSASSTPAGNGKALLRTISAIGSASFATRTTSTRPTEVVLGPGIFDIGRHELQLPSWVPIAGAGSEATTIRAETTFAVYADLGAGEVDTLRDLTVGNTGGPDGDAAGVYGQLDLLDMNIDVEANGGATGIDALDVNATNVDLTVVGNSALDAYVEGTLLHFQDGIMNASLKPGATGHANAISYSNEDTQSFIISSQIIPYPDDEPFPGKCIGDYDATYTAIPDGTC